MNLNLPGSPADVYFGRAQEVLTRRDEIKKRTLQQDVYKIYHWQHNQFQTESYTLANRLWLAILSDNIHCTVSEPIRHFKSKNEGGFPGKKESIQLAGCCSQTIGKVDQSFQQKDCFFIDGKIG